MASDFGLELAVLSEYGEWLAHTADGPVEAVYCRSKLFPPFTVPVPRTIYEYRRPQNLWAVVSDCCYSTILCEDDGGVCSFCAKTSERIAPFDSEVEYYQLVAYHTPRPILEISLSAGDPLERLVHIEAVESFALSFQSLVLQRLEDANKNGKLDGRETERAILLILQECIEEANGSL